MNHEDHLIRGGPRYTCPMHPEIIREEPGLCPICGMALEPREATGEDVNPELPDMTRRFWTNVALTVRRGHVSDGGAFMEVLRRRSATDLAWASTLKRLRLAQRIT